MAYGNIKDLTRRRVSDKILRDKASNIAKNPKYDGDQRGLASMFSRYFDEKYSGSWFKNKHMSGQQLTEELQEPITRKFKKKKYTQLL